MHYFISAFFISFKTIIHTKVQVKITMHLYWKYIDLRFLGKLPCINVKRLKPFDEITIFLCLATDTQPTNETIKGPE